MKKMTLNEWNGESKAKQNELLATGTEVTDDNGKVLFGTAPLEAAALKAAPTASAEPEAPAYFTAFAGDIEKRFSAIEKRIATPAPAPEAPQDDLDRAMALVERVQGYAARMSPREKVSAGITPQMETLLATALAEANKGNVALLKEMSGTLADMRDQLECIRQGGAGGTWFGGEDVPEDVVRYYGGMNRETVSQHISAARAREWELMGTGEKVLYYLINYGLPLLGLGLAAIFGAAVGGTAVYAAGRMWGSDAESDLTIEADFEDAGLREVETGTYG